MNTTTHVQRRLAETIAWCAAKDWAANPAEGLRTDTLRPPEPEPSDDTILSWRATPQERQQIVEQLAIKRAKLLREQGIPPSQLVSPLAGRLLAFNPEQTLSDGAAEAATRSFIDCNNIPAWDTWIVYVTNDPVTKPGWDWNGTDSYLLSWVPEPLVEIVTNGIEVNPEECIFWATDLTSAFIHQLREAGLLR